MSIKNALIGSQFELKAKIGQGSFGKVYLAHDLKHKKRAVAVKTEPLNSKFSQLLKEIQAYQTLKDKGFPKLISKGISSENEILYVTTDLLGPSLEDLFQLCGKKFSYKTTLMLLY